jgi:hypothetical protein
MYVSKHILIIFLHLFILLVIPTTMDTSGTKIIITGINFGLLQPEVTFLGANNHLAGLCSITSTGHTKIECISPQGRGTGSFSVFVKSGNQLSEILAFAGTEKVGLPTIIYNNPRISNIILPIDRSTSGNFILRLEGANFGGNKTTTSGGVSLNGNGVEVSIGDRLCTPILKLTHNIIDCIVSENEGGKNNGIRVVVAGKMSSNTADEASSIARLSFSKPVIESIEGWPQNGMPTTGGKNLTIIGRNFGLGGGIVTRTLKIGIFTYTSSDIQLSGNHTRLTFIAPPGEDTKKRISITVTGQTSEPTFDTYDYASPIANKITADRYPTSGCNKYLDADSKAQARICADPSTFEIHGSNFGLSLPSVIVKDFLGNDLECTIIQHNHVLIKAVLRPGIGSAIVTIKAGSAGLQRKSNSLTFMYDKPAVYSVWSGPTLKSLKVSGVFDASAPKDQILFIFGENFGETSTSLNVTLNGKPCDQAIWNPAARNTKPQGFPYITCKPFATRIGPQEISITVGGQTGTASKMVDGSHLAALCSSGFYGLQGEWCVECWHYYVENTRKYVANCSGEYMEQAWPYSDISGSSEPVPLAEFHSWPPSECIGDPEFCLKSFAESSGASLIPKKCSDIIVNAETALKKQLLSVKINETFLDHYPFAKSEDECNEPYQPGLFCHPLRVNISSASATSR